MRRSAAILQIALLALFFVMGAFAPDCAPQYGERCSLKGPSAQEADSPLLEQDFEPEASDASESSRAPWLRELAGDRARSGRRNRMSSANVHGPPGGDGFSLPGSFHVEFLSSARLSRAVHTRRLSAVLIYGIHSGENSLSQILGLQLGMMEQFGFPPAPRPDLSRTQSAAAPRRVLWARLASLDNPVDPWRRAS